MIFLSGKNCEKIVSACQSGPCMNGATCYNTDNTYICNCTEKSAGRNCEELIVPNIISGPTGITQEELYIIIGKIIYIYVVVPPYKTTPSTIICGPIRGVAFPGGNNLVVFYKKKYSSSFLLDHSFYN